MREIPKQLQTEGFRFFLVAYGSKYPIEKRWNTDNSYIYSESKLHNWIALGGNVGVITGYNKLIVIDFDNREFQNEIEPLLPQTFTITTAIKRLHHLYYFLQGDMIRTIGVGDNPRLCDIKGEFSGVICPPSFLNGNTYTLSKDIPINMVTYQELKKVFRIEPKQALKRFYHCTSTPINLTPSFVILSALNVQRTGNRHFKCPFHEIAGKGNLVIFDDGGLFCFHCRHVWQNAELFARDYKTLITR